jgi:hypothetical protein
MRVIAILATYNEERFVAGFLENLIRQGLQVYVVDSWCQKRGSPLCTSSVARIRT